MEGREVAYLHHRHEAFCPSKVDSAMSVCVHTVPGIVVCAERKSRIVIMNRNRQIINHAGHSGESDLYYD